MTSVADPPATSFTLITLGELTLKDESGVAVSCPDKVLLLLAFLATQPDGARNRRDLANLIWPDAPDEAADTNLRSALRRMRLAVRNAPLLLSEGTALRRNPVALLCDLDAVPPSERPVAQLTWLTAAVARGFLDRDLRHTPAIEHWIAGVRATHRLLLRAAFFHCYGAHRAAAGDDVLQAAAVSLLVHDPADEEVRRALQGLSASAVPVRSPLAPPGTVAMSVAPDDPAAPSATVLPFVYPGLGPSSPIVPTGGGFEPAEPSRPQATAAAQAEAHLPIARPPRPVLPRLALLPPDTARETRQAGALANALIEDVTIGLCSLRSVSVVAPFTAERYRASADKAALLERHGVTYTLDTRRSYDSVYAQLIFVPGDEIIWAARFPLTSESLAAQRVAIARGIIENTTDRLEQSKASHLDYQRRPDAYVAYLKGTQHLGSLELADIRKARRMMRETLQLDAGFAPAMAGMARALVTEWLLTARGDKDLLLAAERQALRAVQSDPGLASAYRELGVVALYRGRLDESLEALQKAETISPHYADVLYSHADTLVHGARPREALEKITRAIDLNPLCPDSYLWSAAGACYFLGDYDSALAYIKRMDNPRPADRLAAASWGMLGNTRQARVYRQRVLQEHPDFELERWLELVPNREAWQRELYREGLRKAGF
ncbi:hypothetical protein ACLE20_12190 [Rhizobium sp. YIM 134829]|uniref:hypothetical protein n=1 Tax=Rhizobium sp. YIM 134829 TaxID=3390453 RepID=UPI003979C5AF